MTTYLWYYIIRHAAVAISRLLPLIAMSSSTNSLVSHPKRRKKLYFPNFTLRSLAPSLSVSLARSIRFLCMNTWIVCKFFHKHFHTNHFYYRFFLHFTSCSTQPESELDFCAASSCCLLLVRFPKKGRKLNTKKRRKMMENSFSSSSSENVSSFSSLFLCALLLWGCALVGNPQGKENVSARESSVSLSGLRPPSADYFRRWLICHRLICLNIHWNRDKL